MNTLRLALIILLLFALSGCTTPTPAVPVAQTAAPTTDAIPVPTEPASSGTAAPPAEATATTGAIATSRPAIPLVGGGEPIYAAILDANLAGVTGTPVIILDITATTPTFHEPDETYDRFQTEHPELTDDLIDGFLALNETAVPFPLPLPTRKEYQTLNAVELEALAETDPNGDAWAAFNRAFPDAGGTVTFSQVAFDQTGNYALVYLSVICGGTCGNGRLVFLNRTADGWRVEGEYTIWEQTG